MIDLSDQHGRCRLAHGCKLRQTLDLLGVREVSGVVVEGFLSIGLDLRDLSRDHLVAREHAVDVASEEWRKRAAVTGLHRFEPFSDALADAFAGQPNSVERQKSLDPSNDAGALLNQVFSFSFDSLCILLFDSRNMNLARHSAITRKPCAQCACHAFRIKAIRLGAAATARHQEARRIENNCANATRDQKPGKPKTIVADLVAQHDLKRPTQLGSAFALPLLRMPIRRSTSPVLILWTVALLSPGPANAQTQLVLLSSSAAQQTSRVSMAIVIGGTPVLITSVTLIGGHDSVPSRFIGSTTTAPPSSARPTPPIPPSPRAS